LFLPVAAASFVMGVSNYLYTYFGDGRFTNMSALLMSTGVIIFFVGLLSEQVCTLTYATVGRTAIDDGRC